MGADMSDYFNYGLFETSWWTYATLQQRIRRELRQLVNAAAAASGGSSAAGGGGGGGGAIGSGANSGQLGKRAREP
jgi:uncharacterized membrane protein